MPCILGKASKEFLLLRHVSEDLHQTPSTFHLSSPTSVTINDRNINSEFKALTFRSGPKEINGNWNNQR